MFLFILLWIYDLCRHKSTKLSTICHIICSINRQNSALFGTSSVLLIMPCNLTDILSIPSWKPNCCAHILTQTHLELILLPLDPLLLICFCISIQTNSDLLHKVIFCKFQLRKQIAYSLINYFKWEIVATRWNSCLFISPRHPNPTKDHSSSYMSRNVKRFGNLKWCFR